jgi:hypothetical protein
MWATHGDPMSSAFAVFGFKEGALRSSRPS